jgi:hypothetical protein
LEDNELVPVLIVNADAVPGHHIINTNSNGTCVTCCRKNMLQTSLITAVCHAAMVVQASNATLMEICIIVAAANTQLLTTSRQLH